MMTPIYWTFALPQGGTLAVTLPPGQFMGVPTSGNVREVNP